jgi:hypothetical protein
MAFSGKFPNRKRVSGVLRFGADQVAHFEDVSLLDGTIWLIRTLELMPFATCD